MDANISQREEGVHSQRCNVNSESMRSMEADQKKKINWRQIRRCDFMRSMEADQKM